MTSLQLSGDAKYCFRLNFPSSMQIIHITLLKLHPDSLQPVI